MLTIELFERLIRDKLITIFSILIILTTGCQSNDPFIKHFGEIDYNGKTCGIIFLSQSKTESPRYKIKRSELINALNILFSSGYLDKNDNICNISIVSDNEIWISTLIESKAEKKRRLAAINKGYIWLASRGRMIILKKENGIWGVKSEGEWVS